MPCVATQRKAASRCRTAKGKEIAEVPDENCSMPIRLSRAILGGRGSRGEGKRVDSPGHKRLVIFRAAATSGSRRLRWAGSIHADGNTEGRRNKNRTPRW